MEKVEKYRNYMEIIVETRLESLKDSLDVCLCDVCRNDIIAYALNQLPPQYFVTPKERLLYKLRSMEFQHQADVAEALIQAAAVVRSKPRH